MNNSKFNINEIFKDLKDIFRQQLTEKNITLKYSTPLAETEAKIYTDKTKLTQILTNLISNAIKFTSEGTIDFGYQLKSGFLEFYIKDTGIGIPIEMQNIIFERFRQADTSINKKFGGTGLGLSISKGFVELLGGVIWVESQPDKGSTFYFTVPYIKTSKVDSQTMLTVKDEEYELCGTVLIAEDEEFNFLYMEQLLNDKKVNILRAANGKRSS